MQRTRLSFIILAFLVGLVQCFPLKKRDFDSALAYNKALNSSWDAFWVESKGSWTNSDLNCKDSSFEYPTIWYSAIAGRAVSDSQNKEMIAKVTHNLLDYRNDEGWFSATTAKDNDVYIDDNSQVMWVFLDSYKYSGNVEHLVIAKKLMDLIKGQWYSNGGGVRWKKDGDYLASISTTEAALTAARLYEVTQDKSLLQFAKDAMQWLFDNLQDPKDKLIYDGKSISSGKVNHGKLTYSVGVAMSTLAYLGKYDDQKWTNKAIELGQAAIDRKNGFYSNGYWNNQLRYVHLLFVGFADLLTINKSISSKTDAIYQKFISEVVRQAQFIYKYHQDREGYYYNSIYTSSYSIFEHFSKSFAHTKSYSPNKKNFCNNDLQESPRRILVDNVSVAQIFYEVSRVA